MELLSKDKTFEEADKASKEIDRTSVEEGGSKRKGKIGEEGAVTPSTLGC